jgi:hypothetical protein
VPALLSRPPRFLVGRAFEGDAEAYLRQIDALRGRPRVWLLATHARNSEQAQFMERTLVAHLDQIGRRLADLDGSGVRVLLYDLR